MSKIIEHTSNGFKWLLVEVPEGANKLKIATTDDGITLLWYGLPILRGFFSIELPSPSWEIVGKADSLTEEQWEEIVELLESDEHEWQMFKDYEDKWLNGYNTTTESGLTLLRSHGLNISETLILKSTQLL